MSYTTMWSYIWDIVDDGVEEVLGVLKNDVGLDAISLATSYHSVDHLRPHTKGKRIFVSYDASIYFQPDEKLYKDTYIKPYVNPIVGDGNPLSEISDQCDKIGLKLISWTVCIHNTHTGRTYPQAAQRNVFSDIYAAYPCPSNPAVQEYFKALLKDLTCNYNMYAIEVESLSFGGYVRKAHQRPKRAYGSEASPTPSAYGTFPRAPKARIRFGCDGTIFDFPLFLRQLCATREDCWH